MKPFLSVVISAYNEAKRIPRTLVDIDAYLSRVEYSSEIVVVNDGSNDETADIVRRFQAVVKNLRCIDNKENHGKGWGIRLGMREAKGNWRIFMDADNSTSIGQIERMIPFFKEYDIIIGSRAVRGATLNPPQRWRRRILGRIGNFIIRLLAVPGIKDTQCGFKCFSEEAAEKIFPSMKINRWGFDVEALALARAAGYKIKEIPVTWVNDTRSTVSAGAYLSTLVDVVAIRWRLMRSEYDISKIKKEL